MKFLAVILFCQSSLVPTCAITSNKDLYSTKNECRKTVERKLSLITASGLIARGYCAPVDTGMTI
mgnify:CR=1 FL=1